MKNNDSPLVQAFKVTREDWSRSIMSYSLLDILGFNGIKAQKRAEASKLEWLRSLSKWEKFKRVCHIGRRWGIKCAIHEWRRINE